MGRPAKKTVGRVLQEIRDLKEEEAVLLVAANFLRTRYLPRDSVVSVPQIPCENSPCSYEVIEEVAEKLESMANEANKAATAALKEEM